MSPTKRPRPVTSGEVSVREALLLGAALALVAFALVLTTNVATVLWSFAALAVTLIYPFAKRFLAIPQEENGGRRLRNHRLRLPGNQRDRPVSSR